MPPTEQETRAQLIDRQLDMEHDGFSLDDKRQPTPGDNDIPDVLECWKHRGDANFQKKRDARLAELQKEIAPLKKERLKHHELIHRLKFEEVVADSDTRHSTPDTSPARVAREKAEAELAELQTRIGPLQKEINQLTRQFWVAKDQVIAQNYDLSASRYRQLEQDEVFYEQPAVTLDRMRALEQAAEAQVKALEKALNEERQSADCADYRRFRIPNLGESA